MLVATFSTPAWPRGSKGIASRHASLGNRASRDDEKRPVSRLVRRDLLDRCDGFYEYLIFRLCARASDIRHSITIVQGVQRRSRGAVPCAQTFPPCKPLMRTVAAE